MQNPTSHFNIDDLWGSKEFTISLTASNENGQDTKEKINFIVCEEWPVAPSASFYANLTLLTVGQLVEFTNQSTGHIINVSWDFGDGNTTNAYNPSHTFSSPGLYTITLELTGEGSSDTETKVDYIQVY